eukprot:scpid20771/ scgid16053/ 
MPSQKEFRGLFCQDKTLKRFLQEVRCQNFQQFRGDRPLVITSPNLLTEFSGQLLFLPVLGISIFTIPVKDKVYGVKARRAAFSTVKGECVEAGCIWLTPCLPWMMY